MPKQLTFKSGEVRDACDHDERVEPPGMPPLCISCGKLFVDEADS